MPAGEPIWIYYEFETEADVVTRRIDVFEDGRAVRESLEAVQQVAPDPGARRQRSLVHGPFWEFARSWVVDVTDAEFEELWEGAEDRVE